MAAVRRFSARLSNPLGSDPAAARQGLVALMFSLLASLVAGLMLGSMNDVLERLPGLLVLISAATSVRGTIFGAMGSRLGTAIHTGTYRLTSRRDSVLGQNVLASGVLSLFTAVVLAVLANVVSVAFGIPNPISVAEFITISVIGGMLSSVVVLVVTVALAETSVRANWDFDNVMAPLVTATGDMVTLPALFLATFLVVDTRVSFSVAVVATVATFLVVPLSFRFGRPVLRGILRQTLVIVVASGLLSLLAGIPLEGQLASLASQPALLAMVPLFWAASGSIGGMLSSRLTTKLHLGVIDPTRMPGPAARADIALAYGLALPVFAMASLMADLAALLAGLPSPGVLAMLAVAVLGGMLNMTLAVATAYWGAVASYRLGLDPDNTGIPLVTGVLDLCSSFSFILAVAVVVM
jgi:mgtE-like transporter